MRVKTFAVLVFTTLLSVTAVANVYTPTTFTDPAFTGINNATGVITAGAGIGLISLRSALTAADNLGGTHTVNLSTGTYNLTQAIPNRQITIGNTNQNITINGNGPALTIINNTLDANQDRILFINPSGTTNSPVITVNGVRFQNAFLSSDPFGGAAICAGGGSGESLTVTNCIFDNNVLPAGAYGGAAICMQVRGDLTVDNCTFTNNVSNDADGGAILFIIFNSALGTGFGTLSVTNSTFTGNSVIFPGAGGSNGGALAFTGQGGVTPFNATINNNTFLNNTADGYGGAISANNSPALSIPQIHYNRFVGNSSATSATTSGMLFVNSAGSVNAENNWWGCNTGPTAAGTCDKAAGIGAAGAGIFDADPWMQLKTTALPTQICTNSTSTFTSSFLTNSANAAVGLANLSRVIGLPISFVNPVLGALSAAQPNITAAGTATVTYTSGAVGGNGSVNAVVDNIPAADIAPAKGSVFVSKPAVANPGVTTGTVNIAFSQNFVASAGVAPYTYSTSSTLPANLTLSSAGVLSGNPVVIGTYPIVVNVVDAIGCTGSSATYNLVLVCQVIPVTNPAVTTGIVGTAFSQTFTSSNTIGAIAYTLNSGSLPTGLSLSSAGVLSGTPTQFGTFPITVKVTDANGCTGIGATYNLVISCQTITVTNPGVTTGTNGTAFSQTFTQVGALGGATFTTVSTLPNGLTLSAAGVLSGTPSAPAATYPIVVTVTDGNGCTANGPTYNLVISCQAMSVTNPVVTTGQLNVPFSQTFTQTGGIGAIAFTTASALPNGLSLSTAGVLSGTPLAPAGTFPIVVKATDVNGCFANGATYTLVITACPVNDQTVTASPTSVCAGGASTITVVASQPGVNYTLRIDPANTFVAGPTASNGPAINFGTGPIAATTTYNVLAETDKYSINLNGGQVGFSIPPAIPLDLSNNFTIEGWIKPAGNAGFARLFNKDQSYALGISNNQTEVTFTRHNAGDFSRPFTFVNGTWYHIACTYVSGTVELFVNGASVGTVGGVPAIVLQPATGGQIGSDAGGGFNRFNGNLDNVRIWNSVRTPAQIAANQTAFLTSTGNPTLVASWWIIEGAGNAKDYSANAINATALAGTWQVDAPVAPCSIVLTNKPTVTVTPNNTITLTSAVGTNAQTVCINTAITNITYSTTGATGATFSGLPAGITGNWATNVVTISGSPTTAVGSPFNYTVTLTGGCGTITATGTITVNPTPTVNAVANQVICNNTATAAVNFSGTPAGVVFNWTNNTPSIGLAASGSGNIASFTAINVTNAPVVATITVTPTYTNGGVNCVGTPITFTYTVNPTATVTAVPNQVVCNGAPTTAVNFSSPTTGGTIVYNWTNNTPSIGLAASGSGNIVSFTAINVTTAPVVATITVTPTYTNGGISCVGTAITFTITVNPPPIINPVANQVVCNNSPTANINFTSPSSGGSIVYTWTNNTPSIGLPASGTGDILSFNATNPTNSPATATITVTMSYTNAGITCVSLPMSFTITVNPTPQVNQPANQTVCNATPTAPVTFTTPTTGGTAVFNWTNNTPSIGLAASGSGNIASFTAINTGIVPVTATIVVTPSFTNFVTNNALTFNGANRVSVTSAQTIPSGNSPYTIEAWVKPNSVSGANGIVGWGNWGATNQVNAFRFNGPTQLINYWWANDLVVNTPNVLDGNWHHVVATFNGVTRAIYFDGALAGSDNPSGHNVTLTNNMTIAQTCPGCPGGEFLNGSIDEMRIWNVGRTQAQIVANMNSTIPSNTAGLVAYYRMDEGTGATTADLTGMGNNGTLFNAPTWFVPSTAPISGYPTTTCTGPSKTFTITVNPTPTVAPVSNKVYCNGAITLLIPFNGTAGTVPGTVFNWTNSNPAIGLAASGSGDIAPFAATNGTNAPIVATITVTPVAAGCVGTAITFTITVNPTATVNAVANQRVCNGSTTAAVNFTSPTTGGTIVYNWNNSNPAIGLGLNGVGNIPSFTATNATIAPISSTITVTPTYTNGGVSCVGTARIFTITVNPTPTVNAVANQILCNGSATAAVNFTGSIPGTVYSWSNNNTSIGLAAGADGNIASFIATNVTNVPQVATITVTPSYTSGGTTCAGTPITFTITVNPNPTVNAQANQTVCAGTTTVANFTGFVPGTVYSWTNSNTAIGLGTSGSGNISFIATNATALPITATITVTPSYTNGGVTCSGTLISFTITVNPTPTVSAVPNQVLCNGSNTTAVTFSGAVAGTVFNWTNNNTTIGLAASGTGNIASFIATNVTTVPQSATITVTPSANGCTGIPVSFTITVNPTPSVNAIASQTVCNGAGTAVVTITGAVAGTVFNWTNNNTSIGLGASGAGNIGSFTAINNTNAPVTATITVTPTYTNGGVSCTGASTSFTITVNPTATVNGVSNQTVCNGSNTAAVNFSGGVAGTTYSWTNSNTAIGLAASGTGNIASFTATNSSNAPVTATITVTPSAAGCTGLAVSFTITVNPTPTVNAVANQTLCNGNNTAAVSFSGSVLTTVYNWTNSNTTIGLAASGTGNIASFTAINTTNSVVTATITVTPSFSNGGVSCTGTSTSFTITVNPLPNIIFTNVPPRVCLTDTLVTLRVTPTGGSWSGRGVTGNVFSATAAGLGVTTLSYTVTNANGCTAIAYVNVTVNDCIERHNIFASAIRLYPNPSSGQFNIRFLSDVYKEFSVKIVTAGGQELRNYHFSGLVYGSVIPMNLQELPSGTYFLEVYNTQERASFPFVIVR